MAGDHPHPERGDAARPPREEVGGSDGATDDRLPGGSDLDAVWELFEPVDRDPAQVWRELRSGADADASAGPIERPRASTAAIGSAPGRRHGVFPSVPSKRILYAHGGLTAVEFVLAALIYGGAAVGWLPAQYWLLGLPFLALGVIQFLPIAAWLTGLWVPSDLT